MPRRNRNAGSGSRGPRRTKPSRSLAPSDAILRVPADNARAAVTEAPGSHPRRGTRDADETLTGHADEVLRSLEQESRPPMNEAQLESNPPKRTPRVHVPARREFLA
jgi:hypothetical protein